MQRVRGPVMGLVVLYMYIQLVHKIEYKLQTLSLTCVCVNLNSGQFHVIF